MPFYEYGCDKCGCVKEILHSMSEAPTVECEECNVEMQKRISAPFIISRSSHPLHQRRNEEAKRRVDMRQDLAENYGVTKVTPLPNGEGKGEAEIYRDIKQSGTMVKDQMQSQREQNLAKTEAKQRAWRKAAVKRTEKRAVLRKEMKAKEEAVKRRIVVPKTKPL